MLEVVIVGVVVDEVSGPVNVEKNRVRMIKYKNKFLFILSYLVYYGFYHLK